MLRIRRAIGTPRIIAFAVTLMFSVPPALAQSQAQPGGPARYFRIQDVLSDLDASRKSGREPIRLTSRGNDDSPSDKPKLRGSLTEAGREPFGLFGFRAPDGTLWRKWRWVSSEIAGEAIVISRCRDNPQDCTPGAKRFLSILEAVNTRHGRAQLDEVNRRVNAAIRYVSDMAQHSEPDRWSPPLAALGSGRGDCEDYAIAKYVILREAGYPLSDLRFLLVRDRDAREDHAVLTARHDGRWLILDNRFAAIPEDMQMLHFTPLFALDHEGVKLMAAPYVTRPPAASETHAKPAALFEGDEIVLRGTFAAEAETGPSGGSMPLLR